MCGGERGGLRRDYIADAEAPHPTLRRRGRGACVGGLDARSGAFFGGFDVRSPIDQIIIVR